MYTTKHIIIYITLAAAAFMLSACSQENDLIGKADNPDGRIVFKTSLPGVTSRAGVLTKEKLPYFHVTAFNPADPDLIRNDSLRDHFFNERIDIVADQNKYTSENCIWPSAGKEHHNLTFFAHYPDLMEGASLENSSTMNSDNSPKYDYKINNFTVTGNIADHIDFVSAYTTGNMADHLFSGITLPFAHQLCRIDIKAYSANKSCNIEIAGVRIGGVYMTGTFNFRADASAGSWSDWSNKGIVEYIFGKDDEIVSLKKGAEATGKEENAVSIMGSKIDGENNCAMLIPASNSTPWDYATNRRNDGNVGSYISVLINVTDTTLSAGTDPEEIQRYPYRDLSQGANAINIPVIYFAVDKATGKTISTRIYKNEGTYYTDAEFTEPYTLPADKVVKEFGWAALPITGNWAPGYIYTYTLDYSSGVGLHDPEVSDPADLAQIPKAGDPIISDRVNFSSSLTVKEWNDGGTSGVEVPGS